MNEYHVGHRKLRLETSHHGNVMQAYNTSNESPIPPQAPIAPPTVLPPSPVTSTLEILIEDIQCCFVNVDRMDPKRTSTSAAPAMTQAAIRKLVGDSVSAVWKHKLLPCNCTEDCKVKFATGTLTEEALSWWNSFSQPIGIEEAYKIHWSEFKKLLIKKYCPRTEIKKMEDEFNNLTVKRNDLKTYVRRF
ncbi:reverse transcriptase domain-containing protein [Tanacetum coccineum]